MGHVDVQTIDRATLEGWLANEKVRYAAELAVRIARDAGLAQRMPQRFRDAIGVHVQKLGGKSVRHEDPRRHRCSRPR
jgi:hypothetical protein